MALTDAMSWLLTQAEAISGVSAAPTSPPEETSNFPFAVVKPATGEFQILGGFTTDFHQVWVEIHVSRADFSLGYKDDYAVESFIAKLTADAEMGGNGLLEPGNPTVEFGEMQFAGIDTIGFRYTVPVKILTS